MESPAFQRLRARLIPRDFRGLLAWGVSATVVVLLVNISLLIVSSKLPTTATGAKLLFRGSCDYASSRSTVAHLAINILATLILSASNAAMQCLSAPTRADIDRVHKRGVWLDVGVSSLRNLFHSDGFRQTAWLGLMITSVPLHLVYNSVFLQSTEANAYNTLVVSQDFLHGEWTDTSNGTSKSASNAAALKETFYGVPDAIAKQVQSELPTYSNLSWDECRSAYGVPLVKGWSNLVVVTNLTSVKDTPNNNSILASFWSTPSVSNLATNLFLSSGDDIDFDGYGENHTVMLGVNGRLLSSMNWVPLDFGPSPIVEMQYCYAQPTPAVCTIELFQPFLEAVIVANAIKVLCFVWILYGLPSIAPLVTFGDAVASFLARPDPLTAGGRAVDRDWVEAHSRRVYHDAHTLGTLYLDKVVTRDRWVRPGNPWLRAPSSRQRASTFLATLFLLVLGGVFLYLGVQALQPEYDPDPNPIPDLRDIWNNGLGNIYPQEVFAATLSWTVGGSLLAANAPQLLVSLLYLFYNQYFTLMCVAAEAQSFCVRRQYLRVSRPRGLQRSSFWLGLPFAYSIPLLAACAILHWALSQSLFIAEITLVAPAPQTVAPPTINAVGYSIIGAILLAGLAALLLLALLAVGLGRGFPPGMPLLSSNSIAIAAACHGHDRPDGAEGGPAARGGAAAAEAEAPLKYGVTAVTGDHRGRVGFSSGEVAPLEAGWIYGRPGMPGAVAAVRPKGTTEASSLLGGDENASGDGVPHMVELPRRTSLDGLIRDYPHRSV